MIRVNLYKKTACWSMYWSKGGKKHVRSTGCRDQAEAEKKRRAKERELNDGLPDYTAKLEPLADEWIQTLELGGAGPSHTVPSKARLRKVTKGLNWSTVGDLDDSEAERFIGNLKLAGRTKNAYRQCLTSFGNYLLRKKILKANPFLAMISWEMHRTRTRRRLNDKEWKRLMRAAPTDRRMLYRLAACTGYRRGELAKLRPCDISDEGFVLLDSSDTKNGSEARQPMPEAELNALKRFIRGKPKDQPIWPGLAKRKTAEILRRDLLKAKVPYKTREGVFDFHALRVQYISQLAIRGVPLAMAQQLARHSSPQLTSNIYSKFAPQEKLEAVQKAFE